MTQPPIVPRSHWILTKDKYYELVENFCRILGRELKHRWDEGEVRKGQCNLFDRDFSLEKREEWVDYIAYSIMDVEKERRFKELK